MPITRIERSPRFNDKALRERFMAKAPSVDDYDVLVTEDADGYDADTGRLLFRFRKGAVAPEYVELARASYGKIADIEKPSTTRASAAGELDLEKLKAIRPDVVGVVKQSGSVGFLQLENGVTLKSKVSNPVMSFLAGYGCERFSNIAGPNRITSHFPKEWEQSLPFFRAVDAVHARELPEVHALHLARIAEHHPHWCIPGTALSTCTININYESAYHYDVGDFKDGYSTLTVVEVGKYDGGFLVYPKYGVAFDIRQGDVLMNQSHVDLHGNTPLKKLTDDARRISFVTYLKHKLALAPNRLDHPSAHNTGWHHGRKLPPSLSGKRDIIKAMKLSKK